MKFYLLFVVLIGLNSIAISQNEHAEFLKFSLPHSKAFLKSNKVESVNIEIAVAGDKLRRQLLFDTAGNLIFNAAYDKKGKKMNESYFRYNEFGDVVFEKLVDFENNTSDSTIYGRVYEDGKQVKSSSEQIGYSTEYFYNGKGQIVRTRTINNDGDTILNVYVYEENNRKVEEQWITNHKKKITKNVYDKEGRLTEYQIFWHEADDPNGKLFLHKRLTYGTSGKLQKEEYLGGYFDFDKGTKVYTYDKNGNLIAVKDGRQQETFTYDGNRFLIRKETPMLGPIKSVETYRYTFRK